MVHLGVAESGKYANMNERMSGDEEREETTFKDIDEKETVRRCSSGGSWDLFLRRRDIFVGLFPFFFSDTKQTSRSESERERTNERVSDQWLIPRFDEDGRTYPE